MYSDLFELSTPSYQLQGNLFCLGHKPCVGMCYYQKVLALENKLNDEKAENEIIEVSKCKCIKKSIYVSN